MPFKYSKSKIAEMSVSEVLTLIYNTELRDEALNDLSKEKLQAFIMECFDKGILNDYLNIK